MQGEFCVLLGSLGLMVGCAPLGPPPPLVMGPGSWGGIGWLFLIVIGAGIWVLIRKSFVESSPKRDHLVETLNDIHERLKNLERKINAKEKSKGLEKEE